MNLFRHTRGSGEGMPPGYVSAGEVGHTQFGTPLNEVLFAESDSDPRKWVLIPGHWGAGYRWSDPDVWAETTASLIWGSWVERTPGVQHPGAETVAETALKLAAYGAKFGGFDQYRLFETVTYLYLPDPRESAIVTRVWVDDHPDLTVEQATAVDDPEAIQQPAVEQFRTEPMGPGLKVTRHSAADPDDDQSNGKGIFVAVRYAFAVPNRQAVVIVSASTYDLARMAAAQADLDEFVRTITLSLADGTPVVNGEIPGS